MSFLTMDDITPALMEAVSDGINDYLDRNEGDLCDSIAFRVKGVLSRPCGAFEVGGLIKLFMVKLECQERCKGLPSEDVVVQMARRHKDSFLLGYSSRTGYRLLVKTETDREWASVGFATSGFDKERFSFLGSILPKMSYEVLDAREFVKAVNAILAQDIAESGSSQTSVCWGDGVPVNFGDVFTVEDDGKSVHHVSSIDIHENGDVWLYHDDCGYRLDICERYEGESCSNVAAGGDEFQCSECEFETEAEYASLFAYCPNCGKPIVK